MSRYLDMICALNTSQNVQTMYLYAWLVVLKWGYCDIITIYSTYEIAVGVREKSFSGAFE